MSASTMAAAPSSLLKIGHVSLTSACAHGRVLLLLPDQKNFIIFPAMASYEEVRTLLKFGEWDVNDPTSAEGFSGIFNRARNEKVAGSPSSGNARSMRRHDDKAGQSRSAVRRWFCWVESVEEE